MTLLTQLYVSSLVLLILGVVTVIGFWTIKALFTPSRYNSENIQDLSAFIAYECGEVPVGEAHTRFNFQYFTLAIVFVIFDIITAFLFSWSIVVREDLKFVGFVCAVLFMCVFLIGFLYWWKRDALRWM